MRVNNMSIKKFIQKIREKKVKSNRDLESLNMKFYIKNNISSLFVITMTQIHDM